MTNWCENRLTVIGPVSDLRAFDRQSSLEAELGAKHVDLMEWMDHRHSWQFQTDTPPLQPLKRLSARWPSLTFFLDSDREDARVKGLAKARAGRLKSYRFRY